MLELIKKLKIEHIILSLTFFAAFVLFIFFHIKFNEGLFFDQPAMFTAFVNEHGENLSGYFLFFDERIRFFNNFLVSIPFNIEFFLYKIFSDKISLLKVLNIFTSSYFIVHIFAIVVNFLIAIRTKRYDIAVIGFTLYTIFCLSNALWAVREIHITILLYFALLSYFLSKEKLGKRDIIPITLLIIYMFESFEITVIYGILISLFTCFYTVYKKDANLGIKNLMGTGCFFASVYILIKMCLWLGTEMSGGFNEYIFAIKSYFNTMHRSVTMLSLFSVPPILFACFYRKYFGIKSITGLLLYFTLTALFIIQKTGLVHDASDEINFYAGAMLLVFPIILTILIFDYFEIKIDNKAFVSNLFTIACIIGILQLAWQINGAFVFNKYVNYLKNILKTNDGVFIEMPNIDWDKDKFLRLYTGYGVIHQSVLLSDSPKVEKIIIPSKYRDENIDWSSENMTRETNNIYILHTAIYPMNLKEYVDVSDIVKKVENQRLLEANN